MSQILAVILAAGEGKRMKSRHHKVVNKVCGRPMIKWVCKAAEDAGIKESTVVIGHKAEQVKECLGDGVNYVLQEQQLGTGHAVMQARKHLEGREGQVLVLCGDTPLITSDTISRALKEHVDNKFSATVITADMANPAGYGRIIRAADGSVAKIVEDRDASAEEKLVREINSGMYWFNIKELLDALDKLDNNNNQGEYYLTDTLSILVKAGLRVGACKCADPGEILGINDRVQLSQAEAVMRRKILERHMRQGVTVIDPSSTYIDDEAVIGMDTLIYPGCFIQGATVIGEDCVIGPATRLVSVKVGSGVEIANSVVVESTIDDRATVGPFAYIRPESSIGRNVKIGDFVEIKKSVIGDKTKIPHLAYIGDAEIGRNTNIGCGVITTNYDGRNKSKTVVGSNAFVGCNVNLVAPVEVEDDTYIAAGSTITDRVPKNSLAIARCRQTVKEDWVARKGMQRKEKE